MILIEEHRDLFTVGKEYYLGHCIASDLRMGAGIAVPMCTKYCLRTKLRKQQESLDYPTCILIPPVFNLITKARSNGKPTYETLGTSLKVMRDIVQAKIIKKIAMPKIGCGLDRLQWPLVRNILKETFQGTDVEILVCSWK